MRVKGNGSGIPAAHFEKSKGFGLGNMQERASEIDGRFEIQTVAGHGTTIIVTVPISSFQLAQGGVGRRNAGALFYGHQSLEICSARPACSTFGRRTSHTI